MGLFDRWLPARFDAPIPPDRDHWCTLDVRLSEPLVIDDDGAEVRVVGYFQTLGIRCPDSELEAALNEAITDGDIDWGASDIRSGIDANALERRLRKMATPGERFWYRAGRVMYPEGDY